MKELKNQIYELERELFMSKVRSSAHSISEIISDDFFEFCSSGKVYKYNKGDTWDSGVESNYIDWEVEGFDIRKLSEEFVLATYKLSQNLLNDDTRYTLRSSIWQLIEGKWKMIFHQGTIKS